MTNAHPLDVLFDAAAAGDDVAVPEGWGQGRATFGGLVTGLLLARAFAAYDLDPGSLRAATTSFVAPVAPGAARLEPLLLRRGSSATQTEVRLWQIDDRTGEESVRAVLLASCGTERASSVEVRAPGPSGPLPDPGSVTPLPYVAGLAPEFFAHIDMRIASGAIPFSGLDNGSLTGFMGYREPPREIGVPHFVALVDVWPPAPGQMLARPAGMSSLTWTIELLRPPGPDPAALWWYEVATDAAHHGYGHTHATVFTPAGEPVAISRQTIALFG